MINKACIFNIQRYSLHDGGGIRSIVFFKGCPFTCPWCANPEGLSVKPEIMYRKALCINCSKKINDKCSTSYLDCPSNAKEKIGEEKTIEEIISVVERDQVFYDTSDGGVTLSGGECLMQYDFVLNLLKELKKRNINTAIESTLALKINNIEDLVKYVDTFLIDMKIINKDKAKEVCNINIDIVKENIERIKNKNGKIIIRIPLVPTYTNNDENINEIIRYMKNIKLKEVHLLPFHKLGESKYEAINKEYDLFDLKEMKDEEVNIIKQKFESANISTIVGGN